MNKQTNISSQKIAFFDLDLSVSDNGDIYIVISGIVAKCYSLNTYIRKLHFVTYTPALSDITLDLFYVCL